MCDYSAICVTRWYTTKYPPLYDRRGYICVICAELLTINGVFYVPLCSTKIANLGQTANFYQQNFLCPPSLLCSLSYIHHFHFRQLVVCLFGRSSVCLLVCLSACRRIPSNLSTPVCDNAITNYSLLINLYLYLYIIGPQSPSKNSFLRNVLIFRVVTKKV